MYQRKLIISESLTEKQFKIIPADLVFLPDEIYDSEMLQLDPNIPNAFLVKIE